jgi:hypothetical protein
VQRPGAGRPFPDEELTRPPRPCAHERPTSARQWRGRPAAVSLPGGRREQHHPFHVHTRRRRGGRRTPGRPPTVERGADGAACRAGRCGPAAGKQLRHHRHVVVPSRSAGTAVPAPEPLVDIGVATLSASSGWPPWTRSTTTRCSCTSSASPTAPTSTAGSTAGQARGRGPVSRVRMWRVAPRTPADAHRLMWCDYTVPRVRTHRCSKSSTSAAISKSLS